MPPDDSIRERFTPDEYRIRIEGYSRVCPQFRAVWYDAAQAASLTESLRATLLVCRATESGRRNSPPLTANC